METPRPQLQIHPRPEFLRSNSSSGSPGLTLVDRLTPQEKQFNLGGYEGLIAKTLDDCSRCAFENSFQYLRVLLGLSQESKEVKEGQELGFYDQVHGILIEWTGKHGKEGTLGLLTEQLRNHRTISEKIYSALKSEIQSKGK